MSGRRVTFLGDAMAPIVQGVREVRHLIGQDPVVVGGLAVMCRLTTPYRATTDLDVVDRRRGPIPHLEVLRRATDAKPVEPAAVELPTPYGQVKVDVLEVRQVEIDRPSDDPGDRLHAWSHAWAHDTATPVTIVVARATGDDVTAITPVAEPGPLVAMKLQAVMNRSADKQGTDLQDVVRLVLDRVAGPVALDQIASCAPPMPADIATHVDLWFRRRRADTARRIRAAGGGDLTVDDVDLTAELVEEACRRQPSR